MLSSVACILLVSQIFAEVPTVTLNNGVEMPMMMYGTGNGADWANNTATEMHLRLALQVGFAGVDTARDYENQVGVGRALADVERTSVFVTTKVIGAYGEPNNQTIATAYNTVLAEANENLEQLNVDYVDLLLLHNPPNMTSEDPCVIMQEHWRALEDFLSSGKARAIGVSNYCQWQLDCVLETATVVPAVHQIALHVGMSPDPRGLKSYSDEHGIQTMAYSPLGSEDWTVFPPTKDISLITGNFTKGIGSAYGKSGAQVALRWVAQHGMAFATDATSEKHLREDLEVFEFSLDYADMQLLDAATTPAGEPNGYAIGIPVCSSSSVTMTV